MWDIISKITSILLGFSTLYFYLENRKLKSFEFEREAKIKQAELKNSKSQRHSYLTVEEDDDLGCKIKKKEAELEYFEKMKNYRWIFSK
ncbi:MAG: hypothetical protein PHY72_03605 [Candidatus Pacebacteria bacterium]|nr:hypothetical protein [Candidatus Paceibacterota bacterium]